MEESSWGKCIWYWSNLKLETWKGLCWMHSCRICYSELKGSRIQLPALRFKGIPNSKSTFANCWKKFWRHFLSDAATLGTFAACIALAVVPVHWVHSDKISLLSIWRIEMAAELRTRRKDAWQRPGGQGSQGRHSNSGRRCFPGRCCSPSVGWWDGTP